jgi:hypothetical protein
MIEGHPVAYIRALQWLNHPCELDVIIGQVEAAVAAAEAAWRERLDRQTRTAAQELEAQIRREIGAKVCIRLVCVCVVLLAPMERCPQIFNASGSAYGRVFNVTRSCCHGTRC